MQNGKINTEEPPNADYMALHMSGAKERVILPRPEMRKYKKSETSKDEAFKDEGTEAPPLSQTAGKVNVSRETKSPSKNARKTELKENDKLPRVRERPILSTADAAALGDQDDKRNLAEVVAKFLENLDVQKKKADIQLKRSQTMRHEVIIAEKKKELVPRELVNQEIANFDAELKTNIRELPRRISAQIYAIAVGQGAKAVEIELEAAISDAINRTKAKLL